ncbi:hypothetical protein TWF730_006422 [Orbilia blumenaviensis]|uniref:Chitinase n=1 Tax=Orbilia blumenaviensis TaxID=1796055 RepID=A0AAV9VGJ2_9PEZI
MPTWNSTNGAHLPGIWETPETLLPTLDFMRDHNIQYLFPTALTLSKEGKFAINSIYLTYLHQFMKTIQDYEESPRSQGKTFKVLPVISACFKQENTDEYFDLSNEEVEAEAVKSIKQFLVPDIEGSYITGMPRGFDGVQFNVAGSSAADDGEDNTYDFEILKRFVREIRSTSGKITSLATPKLGGTWASSRFYYAALYVDMLVPMCYNSSCQTAEEYQAFMKDQVYDILRAVAGKYARNHGRPNGVKVLFGFPCFPDGEDVGKHNSAAENIAAAAKGAVDGVNKLVEEGDDSLEFADGASLYTSTDGKGKDGYSTKNDMDDFGKLWIRYGQPPEDTKPNPPKDGGGEDNSKMPLVTVVVAAVLLVCAWMIAVG